MARPIRIPSEPPFRLRVLTLADHCHCRRRRPAAIRAAPIGSVRPRAGRRETNQKQLMAAKRPPPSGQYPFRSQQWQQSRPVSAHCSQRAAHGRGRGHDSRSESVPMRAAAAPARRADRSRRASGSERSADRSADDIDNRRRRWRRKNQCLSTARQADTRILFWRSNIKYLSVRPCGWLVGRSRPVRLYGGADGTAVGAAVSLTTLSRTEWVASSKGPPTHRHGRAELAAASERATGDPIRAPHSQLPMTTGASGRPTQRATTISLPVATGNTLNCSSADRHLELAPAPPRATLADCNQRRARDAHLTTRGGRAARARSVQQTGTPRLRRPCDDIG